MKWGVGPRKVRQVWGCCSGGAITRTGMNSDVLGNSGADRARPDYRDTSAPLDGCRLRAISSAMVLMKPGKVPRLSANIKRVGILSQ